MNIISKFTPLFFPDNTLTTSGPITSLVKDSIPKPLNILHQKPIKNANLALKVRHLSSQKRPPTDGQSTISKINQKFWLGMGCWSTYNLIDAGLSRLLALETLNHGTGPLGYMGISLNGADPDFGGGTMGSSVGGGLPILIEHSKRYFHVFKDSEFSCDSVPCHALAIHLLPRKHAILSGMANFGYSSALKTGNLVSATLGAISGFMTPTLKFRFTPNEIFDCGDTCLFENDPDYHNAAYRTLKPISASRLGIIGTLSQGINADMWDRMRADPAKAYLGMALLGTAAIVAIKTYQYYLSSGQQTQVSSEKASCCQKLKKLIAVTTGWTALAVTAIFLNTV